MGHWKSGQILWSLNPYDVIERVQVVGKPIERDEIPEPYYTVHLLESGGSMNQLESKLFQTFKAALDARTEKRKKEIEYYKSKISTVQELMFFMLEHMNCDDYIAIETAKAKCKELLNVEID